MGGMLVAGLHEQLFHDAGGKLSMSLYTVENKTLGDIFRAEQFGATEKNFVSENDGLWSVVLYW